MTDEQFIEKFMDLVYEYTNTNIVFKGVGTIFKETEPYKPIDKFDCLMYNIAKKHLIP